MCTIMIVAPLLLLLHRNRILVHLSLPDTLILMITITSSILLILLSRKLRPLIDTLTLPLLAPLLLSPLLLLQTRRLEETFAIAIPPVLLPAPPLQVRLY